MSNPSHTNQAGVVQGDSEWLDIRFEALKPEYEDSLRWVGIQPGWRVLDAGCGGGSFLPLMSELVQPNGHITALDLDAANLKHVEAMAAANGLEASVTTRQSSIVELPFETGSFDAVWCANTVQYLNDADLARCLAEFKRVTRPGGLVAIKDTDLTGTQIVPAPSDLLMAGLPRFIELGDVVSMGRFRTINLQSYMRAAGLTDIAQRHIPMVRTYPLRPVERKMLADTFVYSYEYVKDKGMPPQVVKGLEKLANLNAPDHAFNSPDFLYREMQIVFVGRV